MSPCRPILIAVVATAVALPAVARTGHYAITQQQIAAAVSGSGTQVSPDEVLLLASVFATTAQPTLKVQSIQPESDNRAIARIECAQAGQCLPFMVALRTSSGVPPPAAQEQGPSQRQSNVPPLVRAGSSAILLLDGPHIHISLSVRCLESGKLGQTIHAASLDRRQFYTAQVVGDRVLRGRL